MKQSTIFWLTLAAVAIVVGVIGAAFHYSNKPQSVNNQTMDENSKLKVEDVKTGTGAAAQAGDTVTVHYTGTFADGTKFDSSYDHSGAQPFSFTIGSGKVIQGWEQGLVGMQVGGTRKLTIPPSLGYGPEDYGQIPGNSTLHFTIELLKIQN